MSGPVLFVAADPRECGAWVRRWDDVRNPDLPVHWARAGRWRGKEMIAIANGAGRVRATAAVQAAPLPSAVYSIGFCGALDASLRTGDIFIATEILSDGSSYEARLPNGPTAKRGVLSSIARIAQTAAEKKKLRESGAFVVEMEAAGVALASKQLGVSFYCVRAVSDLANEDFANDFNKALMPDGRFDISRLLIGAMKDPLTRVGELIRLSGRTALASKNLGEFLANCRY